ncbi:MAG: undecaprenyl/decaprenyl-phosphate alpha-N-acetylglucosaminyl 1-phosphate transferase [Phycisphaerales bacterium]|nr:undecaprenyl/decaprenyl-phosphate alpha-N-acetylglucosaminyl 1-phosphate transferase [Phycisphaerales bacterium]
MVLLCIALIPVALILSLPLTALVRRLSLAAGAFDGPGVAGQVKMSARRVPNTGGIAIFLAFAAPVLIGLAQLAPIGRSPDTEWREEPSLVPADLHEHVAGIADRAPEALILLGCLAVLHILGLIDDRRPLGPWFKLTVMLGVSAAAVHFTNTRLLTMLDAQVGGPWLSILLTILWLGVVTNAMNFLDNMDGLAAGVASIAASFFLAAALINQQWFIAAMLAMLVGSLLGFLWFNFPIGRQRHAVTGGATIFMGDGGSLVVGFLLAFLTARTTFHSPRLGGGWYAVLMPLVVLAIPLYDFIVVSAIRIAHGKSPFVGDLNHLSHRLVRRGLTRRQAVLVIWGLTAVTAIGGISLGQLRDWQAVLVGVQTVLVLLVLAIVEYAGSRPSASAPTAASAVPAASERRP